MTDNNPIKVRLSLNKFKMAVLIKLTIIFTSFIKFPINLPECLLSTNWVSALIKDANISVCISFLTSSDTFIIITLAKYNEAPLIIKAKIIRAGINMIKFWDLFINNSLIAGSSK